MIMEKPKWYVYLDGRFIGNVKSGRKFAEEVRKNRRLGIISGEVNVACIKKHKRGPHKCGQGKGKEAVHSC